MTFWRSVDHTPKLELKFVGRPLSSAFGFVIHLSPFVVRGRIMRENKTKSEAGDRLRMYRAPKGKSIEEKKKTKQNKMARAQDVMAIMKRGVATV